MIPSLDPQNVEVAFNLTSFAGRIASAFILLATMWASNTQAWSQDQSSIAGVELLGRGVLYSVNYERYFTERAGLGIGAALYPSGNNRLMIVPLYGSWNPVGDRHSLYLGAGTTLAFGSLGSILPFGEKPSNWSMRAMGTASVGYQYRSFGGFVIRPTVSFLMLGDQRVIWPGIILGRRF